MNVIKRTDNSPLVSIICRTMSRPSLQDTLRSVLNQTWRNLELVLVDAANVGPEVLGESAAAIATAPHIRLNIVAPGTPLDRPRAANAGLTAATGAYLLYLDDDDWIAAGHINRLMAQTDRHPDCLVLYSATQKTDADASLLDDIIAVPFDRTVLRRDNFIPIHAALFAAELRDRGCRFDESLAVYEDWDFWLQCAEHTDFVLDNHVGAYYRMGGDSETMLSEHQARYQPGHPMAEARAKLLDKWKSRWTGAQWNAVLGLVDQTPLVHTLHQDLGLAHQDLAAARRQLDKKQEDLTALHNRHEQLQANWQQLSAEHQAMVEEYQSLQSAHIELNLAHQALDQGVKEILSSFSWRVTAPYRWTRRRLSDAVTGALYKIRRQQAQTATPVAADDKPSQHSPLQCGIVTPASDGLAFSTTLTVQAWAWSPDALLAIEILLDGIKQHTVEPLPTHADLADAQRIGFARALATEKLSPGEHVITLVCTDSSGRRTECQRRFVYQRPQALYSRWRQHQLTAPQISAQPTTDFQLLLRVTDTDIQSDAALLATLDSLTAQNLTSLPQVHWRCAIISAAANHEALAALLSTHAAAQRIRLISEQSAFDASAGSVAVLLQAGDILHPDCLGNAAVNWQPTTRLLYTDHDRCRAGSKADNPWFTFGWSPELLLSQNYIGGVYFVSADLLPPLEFDTPAWRYDCLLQLRDTLQSAQVTRLPRVLWSDTDGDPQASQQAELDVLRTRLADHNIALDSPWPQTPAIRHAVRPMPAPVPRVSIIIPTTGNMRFLKPCLDTLASTDYPDMEIVILDNSSG